METKHIIIGLVVIWVGIYGLAIAPVISIWTKAFMGGVPIPLMRIFGMRLKKINAAALVDAHIQATQAEANIPLEELEKHCLAGGNILKAVSAYIKVINRKIDVPFSVVCQTDLAGFDLDEVDSDQFKKYNGANHH